MLKKTITYKDLDDNDVTEDFYFNLSKAEIAEMELSQAGGLSTHLKAILERGDNGQIVATFKMILSTTVGKRSEDGRRFIKSPEITNEFLQTDAYSTVFMELVTNANAAAEFIKGVIPSDMSDEIAKEAVFIDATKQRAKIKTAIERGGEVIRNITDFSPEELRDMSRENFALLRSNTSEIDHPKTATPEDYSYEELGNMSQALFDQVAGTNPQKMSRDVLLIAMQRMSRGLK